MKVLLILFLGLTSLSVCAQDIQAFEATILNVNKKGKKIENTLEEPTTINVNLETSTFIINTTNEDAKELLRNKSVFTIDKQMGELGVQYSLQIEEHIFVHFYLERKMILLTRNDIHPLQWGLQFMDITILDTQERID